MATITVLDAFGVQQIVQVVPAVGPATKANAMPVTTATDDPVLAALAAPVLPSGAATSALQTTGNTAIGGVTSAVGTGNASLASIDGKTGVPLTTGGLLNASVIAAASTNSNLVKASAGQVYAITVANNSATVAFLKVYNTSTAPTAGAGTPALRILVPANSSVTHTFVHGLAFAAGIGFTLTGAIADADTTATAASTMLVNVLYK